MKIKVIILCIVGVLFCYGCNKISLLKRADFKCIVDNKQIDLFTLNSDNGLIVQITNYGGRIVSIWFPDRDGNYADLVVGYGNINQYLAPEGNLYFGAIIGRYANRIANGKFLLDGREYQLEKNNNGNCMHGGFNGYNNVIWSVLKHTNKELRLSYTSIDGDGGFPGTLKVTVVYKINTDNELEISYEAVSDKNTIVNLTNHTFFNLKGCGNGTITDNILYINADSMTPVDNNMIPTGQIMSVNRTPFDFRNSKPISSGVNSKNIQIQYANGYDHNWVLNRKSNIDNELAASLYEPKSGRLLQVFTNQPGIQIYTGNYFNGSYAGKYGNSVKYREAIAIETQKFPDSPNHLNFPSTTLRRGEIYKHLCIYKFNVK